MRGRSVKLYGGKIRLARDIPRDRGFVAMEGVRPMDDSGKKKLRERMTLTSGPGVSMSEENGTRSSAVEEGRGGCACCLRAFGPAEHAAGPRQGERGFGPLRRRRGGVRGLGRGQERRGKGGPSGQKQRWGKFLFHFSFILKAI